MRENGGKNCFTGPGAYSTLPQKGVDGRSIKYGKDFLFVPMDVLIIEEIKDLPSNQGRPIKKGGLYF